MSDETLKDRKLNYTTFYDYDSMMIFVNRCSIRKEDIQQIIVNGNQVVMFWWA